MVIPQWLIGVFSVLTQPSALLKRSSSSCSNALVNTETCLRPFFTFLIGLIAGGSFRWGYVRLLRTTIRFYEYYIRERIDKQQEQFLG